MKSKLLITALLAVGASLASAAPSDRANTGVFNRADTNHDALLDQTEFDGLLKTLKKAKAAKPNKKGHGGPNAAQISGLTLISELVFSWYDSDASSGISLDEWLAGRAGEPLPPPPPPAPDPNAPAPDPNAPTEPTEPVDPTPESPDLALVPFEAVDRNGNGALNFGEWNVIFKDMVPTGVAKEWYAEYLQIQADAAAAEAGGGTAS